MAEHHAQRGVPRVELAHPLPQDGGRADDERQGLPRRVAGQLAAFERGLLEEEGATGRADK